MAADLAAVTYALFHGIQHPPAFADALPPPLLWSDVPLPVVAESDDSASSASAEVASIVESIPDGVDDYSDLGYSSDEIVPDSGYDTEHWDAEGDWAARLGGLPARSPTPPAPM